MRVPGRAQRHSFISVTRTFVKFCFVFYLFIFILFFFFKFWFDLDGFSSFFFCWFLLSRPSGPLPCLALHCRSVPFFPRFWICFKPKAVLSIKTTRIGTYISIYVHASVWADPITSGPLWFDPFPSAQSDLLSPTAPPAVLSSFLFSPIFLPSFGFYPPFPFPFLGRGGRAPGFALSPLQVVFVLGEGCFFPFELSLPDDLGLSWIYFPPIPPLPLGFYYDLSWVTFFWRFACGGLHDPRCWGREEGAE